VQIQSAAFLSRRLLTMSLQTDPTVPRQWFLYRLCPMGIRAVPRVGIHPVLLFL
jgi:hypothetical protein